MKRLSDGSLRSRLRLLMGLLLLACVSALASPSWAEEPEEKAKRSQDISRTTMSPFCPGRTLESCPSPYATQWREDIRKMVSQGMSTDEIRSALEKRSASDLSGSPSTMLDGVLPALVTLIAVLLLTFLLRAMVRSRREEIGKMVDTKDPEPKESDASPVDEKDLDERLRAELDSMENDSLDDR